MRYFAIIGMLWVCARRAAGFGVTHRTLPKNPTARFVQQPKTRGYKDSAAASKGIVSSLTNLVNYMSRKETVRMDDAAVEGPATPQELLERIRDNYVVNNYLWTGDIDLSAFDRQCRFTDPTLSFTGTDTFVQNIKNLRPIVDALTKTPNGTQNCRSDLLDIKLKEGYVRTRWNMVGELIALPWKPRIDVIGRTEFWYDDSNKVVLYDEEWEIPAGRALLQIITPPGTIANTWQ